MNKEDIFDKIVDILRDEFEDDELEITNETTAADVEGWDSLAHLSIVHEIEVEFGIKFNIGEIQEFKNVGEMVDSVVRHNAQ